MIRSAAIADQKSVPQTVTNSVSNSEQKSSSQSVMKSISTANQKLVLKPVIKYPVLKSNLFYFKIVVTS